MDPSRLRNLTAARSDRIRLIALGALLIVVVFLFLFLRGGMDSTTPPPLDLRPFGIGESAPPAAAVEPARLAEVADASAAQRLVREQQPFLHLLMESAKLVPGDFRRLQARALDGALYEQVQADPAAHRGQPFSARGFFTFAARHSVPLDVDGSGGADFPYFQGLLQDDFGRQFSFSALEVPADLAPGEIVRMEGFFFKRFGLFAPDAPAELIDGTLHLVGKRLVRSFYRMEPVRELSQQLLGTVRDYDVQDQLTIPDDVLFHVLSYVQNLDADVLAAAAEDCTAFQLRSNPEQYRGLPVRVLGTFHQSWPQHLGPAGENPLDLPVVFHGLLVHGGPTFTYLVSPEREPAWTAHSGIVIAEGIFVKRYAYQAAGGEIITCPLLVVKRFVEYRVDTSSVSGIISAVFLGLAVLLLIWFGISALGDRRANEQYRRHFLERRQARREKHQAGEAADR